VAPEIFESLADRGEKRAAMKTGGGFAKGEIQPPVGAWFKSGEQFGVIVRARA